MNNGGKTITGSSNCSNPLSGGTKVDFRGVSAAHFKMVNVATRSVIITYRETQKHDVYPTYNILGLSKWNNSVPLLNSISQLNYLKM
ncbi:hypothetical protein QTP88_022463 [Uroleucon formosanum]